MYIRTGYSVFPSTRQSTVFSIMLLWASHQLLPPSRLSETATSEAPVSCVTGYMQLGVIAANVTNYM